MNQMVDLEKNKFDSLGITPANRYCKRLRYVCITPSSCVFVCQLNLYFSSHSAFPCVSVPFLASFANLYCYLHKWSSCGKSDLKR